jgi:hypothetical protein
MDIKISEVITERHFSRAQKYQIFLKELAQTQVLSSAQRTSMESSGVYHRVGKIQNL